MGEKEYIVLMIVMLMYYLLTFYFVAKIFHHVGFKMMNYSNVREINCFAG